jgi:hypothetical protein
MKRALVLAAVFSLTAFVLLGVADFAVWGGYQGMHPRQQVTTLAITHAVMLAAMFLFSLVGSALAFIAFRHRLPSHIFAVAGGAVFALASFFAVVATFKMGGLLFTAVWLLLGSALVATVACLLAPRRYVG